MGMPAHGLIVRMEKGACLHRQAPFCLKLFSLRQKLGVGLASAENSHH